MALFESARAIDLVLGFVVLEALLLLALRRRLRRGPSPREILALLLPGACLMLAVRAALTGPSGVEIGGWLLAALVSHLVDLGLRWRTPGPRNLSR